MRNLIGLMLAFLVSGPCNAAGQEPPKVRFLTFPASASREIGQVERLAVTVNCGWISSFNGIPELYDVEMGYDMPTQNTLEARPRLGAAAVTLSDWSGVIGIRLPQDKDAQSCFAVTVSVEGRNGVARSWTDSQLGLQE